MCCVSRIYMTDMASLISFVLFYLSAGLFSIFVVVLNISKIEYLIGQNNVGQKWRSFSLVTKILSDEKFCRTKILTDEKFCPANNFVQNQIFEYCQNSQMSLNSSNTGLVDPFKWSLCKKIYWNSCSMTQNLTNSDQMINNTVIR